MPRYKLTLAYQGTNFHGWQRQGSDEAPLRTVQSVGRGERYLSEAVTSRLLQGVQQAAVSGVRVEVRSFAA